jgi:formylglycine-generating enzyme required for sulfatase activity
MNQSAMFDKRLLGSAAGTVIGIVLLLTQSAGAAQMKVANVAAAADGFVQFDISWTDSWRVLWKEGSIRRTNWDAAWIFVKYRAKGEAAWSHAILSTKNEDHSAPKGAKIQVGLSGDDATGAFLYRAAEGRGSWANKGVKLKWFDEGGEVPDPEKIELFVHAIEMVFVPKGAFYAGGGGKLAGSFTDGSRKKRADVIPMKITGEGELSVAPQRGCLYGTATGGAAHTIGPVGSLSDEFPKGYGAFYCMKYETSQGQYAAFLNQLTAVQAAKRYPFPTIPAKFSGDGIHTVRKTATGYAASKPDRACNWVSWDDCVAYLDWAGLRPMSELEYEKACRGPLKPVKDEYAWGPGALPKARWLFDITEAPPVPKPYGLCGSVGRKEAGCTYWGIATMSGHLRERTVTVGHLEGRRFTGICGDGALTHDGFADTRDWPGPSESWPNAATAGGGFRGGPWYKDKARLRVSDRFLAACLRKQRDRSYGFRGVRHEPGPVRKIDERDLAPRSEFGGLGGNAHHVVYLIDRSGSMFDIMDAVNKQITTSVKNLKPKQDFHVIMFANGAPLEKKPMSLAPPTPENRLALDKFLSTVKPEGTTNPVKAINRAFDVLAKADNSRGKLIYMLTDGVFSDNEAVMSAIRVRNRRRRVMINTFLYGWKPPLAVKVMTQIARENGGGYKYIDPDK